MSPARLVSVLGLGFGDCGKGLFVDHLCRRLGAHTVVRFNGGAQAGHNVVLADGRHHTFSQFGSGSFQRGMATVLAHPVVVHPTALQVEAERLASRGVPDALARLFIDPRCRVNTPFHQAAGRLRELARGATAHGTCGVGVGETVRHALAWPEEALRFEDLQRPAHALEKARLLQRRLRDELADVPLTAATASEWSFLQDPDLPTRWMEQVGRLLPRLPPAPQTILSERLHCAGTVLFEGAQGLLLDEWRGFHPHTTWSSPHPTSVEALVREAGLGSKVHHLGVLRAYLTRHGLGPLPTEDAALDRRLGEPHNSGEGWQGPFRRGHPDGVLLDYALAVAGALDGVLLSHLDAFREGPLNWCDAYEAAPRSGDGALCVRAGHAGERILRLRPGIPQDLVHQSRLTHLLAEARPCYAAESVPRAEALVERMEDVAGCRILLGASGPTGDGVQDLRPLGF